MTMLYYVEPRPGNEQDFLRKTVDALSGYDVTVIGFGYPPIYVKVDEAKESDFKAKIAALEGDFKEKIMVYSPFPPTQPRCHRRVYEPIEKCADEDFTKPQPHEAPPPEPPPSGGHEPSRNDDKQPADDKDQPTNNGDKMSTNTQEQSQSQNVIIYIDNNGVTSSSKPLEEIVNQQGIKALNVSKEQLIFVLSNPVSFKEDELAEFCEVFLVNYFELPGTSQKTRVGSLVEEFDQRDKLPELMQAAYKKRKKAFDKFMK